MGWKLKEIKEISRLAFDQKVRVCDNCGNRRVTFIYLIILEDGSCMNVPFCRECIDAIGPVSP